MLLERDFEDILVRYPELIEDNLTMVGRQLTVFNRRMDLVFKDKYGRRLIIELKAGPIKDAHIGQILSYEGMLLSANEPSIRVMLIGNRVPPNLQRALDHHGIAWKEISYLQITEFLEQRGDEELLARFKDEVNSIAAQANKRPAGLSQSARARSEEESLPVSDQIVLVLNDKIGQIFSSDAISKMVSSHFGTNPTNIEPSHFCYNLYNEGSFFQKHFFEYLGSNKFKYLGEKYPFNGPIYFKTAGSPEDRLVGKWVDGNMHLIDELAFWRGIDQSRYTFEQVFKRQKSTEQVQNLIRLFHDNLKSALASSNMEWFARTHLFGISYFCINNKVFLWLNINKGFASAKYFTDGKDIVGIVKANWIVGGDNTGSIPFRITRPEEIGQAVSFSLEAYKIAAQWM